jgi:predicted nucleic acid-binding protein
LVVSDLVVAEVYFALQHHYGVPKHEALRCIEKFLSKSGVKALGAAATVLGLRNLATAEPGFVDRLIHAEYMQWANEVLTFERTGGRLPGVRVLTAS